MRSLEGLKVLDLSRVLAGPLCTQMLADLGAVVWKIESPAGDDTRHWGPPFRGGESAYFLSANRGKKSLAVNLKDPRGAALVRRLARKADVLVENFKHGDLQRHALDYPALAAENPRLVHASITGFGHTGPRAGEPGYDVVAEALTGIMSVTGEVDGPPSKVGVAWIDVMTGLTATIGILAALRARDASGVGQHIDLGMHDVGLMAMVNQAQAFLMTGAPPQRHGNAHPQIVPYQSFRTADGWLMLAVGNDAQFRRMAGAIGHPGLGDDPRYRSNADRVAARDQLVPELAAIFRQRTRAEWMQVLAPAGVPAAPVQDIAEAFADPQARARGALWSLPHHVLGDLPQVANPLRHMTRTPARPTLPPPTLGQHTEEVLAGELGVDAPELSGLRAAGVIGDGRVPASRA